MIVFEDGYCQHLDGMTTMGLQFSAYRTCEASNPVDLGSSVERLQEAKFMEIFQFEAKGYGSAPVQSIQHFLPPLFM